MKKRRSAEQIVGLLRQTDVDLGKGANVSDVCRFTERRRCRERPVRILVNVIPVGYCEKTKLTCDVQAPSDRPTFALTSGR
jgi:hypothetical protein